MWNPGVVSARTVATSAEKGSHSAIARGTASMPAIDSLRCSVRDQLRFARRGEKRAALHELAELIRFRFGIELPDGSEANNLARRIRAAWDEREILLSSDSMALEAATEPWIRADLVDLAVMWAELRLRLAAPDAPERRPPATCRRS